MALPPCCPGYLHLFMHACESVHQLNSYTLMQCTGQWLQTNSELTNCSLLHQQ
jgi:hypothetical protein